MTELLSQAFQKASELPDSVQDELARQLLDEMTGESRWDETLAESQEKVDQLAEKAIGEYKAGATKEMGFDEL